MVSEANEALYRYRLIAREGIDTVLRVALLLLLESAAKIVLRAEPQNLANLRMGLVSAQTIAPHLVQPFVASG